MSSYQLPIWVWPVALMIVCVLAVWRGRDEERLASAGLLAAWAISMVAFRAESEDTQWSIFLIDSCLFGLYLFIAMRSRRYWPLFLAGFGLLIVVTHFAHALDAGISGWAYWTAARIWNYLCLFMIGYGAWTAPRRYAEIEAADPNDVPGATRR